MMDWNLHKTRRHSAAKEKLCWVGLDCLVDQAALQTNSCCLTWGKCFKGCSGGMTLQVSQVQTVICDRVHQQIHSYMELAFVDGTVLGSLFSCSPSMNRLWGQADPAGETSLNLTSILQGPDEHIQDFTPCLLQTSGIGAGMQLSCCVSSCLASTRQWIWFLVQKKQTSKRIISDTEASKLIIHLAFENADKWCKEGLRAHKIWATLAQIFQICVDIGPSYVQGAASVAAITQVVHPREGRGNRIT